MSLQWPLKSVSVTGDWANSPAFYAQFGQLGHNGIDLAASVGTPVYAADDGVIRDEGWGQNNSWMGSIAGIFVLITHKNQITGYAHLSRTIVDRGQHVKRGQLIGYSGATGVGTGPHLHFETLPHNPNFSNGFAGRVNPRTYGLVAMGTPPAELLPTQRKTGANPAKRRTAPTSKSAEKQPPLAANTVGNFTGWIYGEQVADSVASTNIWFRGTSGDWFWAGAFTNRGTAGLTDLNPKTPPAAPKPAANQRQADPVPVNVRASASTKAAITASIAANAIVTPEGWVTGEAVQGISIWYKLQNGYAWAGGFTVEDASGLNNLNPTTPTPDPQPDPNAGRGPGPVLNYITRWDDSAPQFGATDFSRPVSDGVALMLPQSINETMQRPEGGFYYGREDLAVPINHVVLHHAAGASLSGTVSTLKGVDATGEETAPTANWVVKDNDLVEMVDERDTPSTNGRWRSNQYSSTIEICNDGSPTGKPSAASHETAAWVLARTALRWKFRQPLELGVNVFGHKDVSKSPTSCPGDLDMQKIVDRANEIIDEKLKEDEQVSPPDNGELVGAISGLSKLIQLLIDMLKKIFRIDT